MHEKNVVLFLKKAGARMFFLFSLLFASAIVVGDPNRARKRGEDDEDAKRLGELNRIWRQMLDDDPWMVKLMTHVRALRLFVLLVWAALLFLVVYFRLPPNHWTICAFVIIMVATVPYWAWIGRWFHTIERKVFDEFKKKFGKHFHLR